MHVGRSPKCAMFEHVVKYEEQLTHACDKRHLFGFTSGAETLVEGLDNRVVTSGHKSSHVEGSPNSCTSTPYDTFAPKEAAVTIERSDTHQMSDLFAIQGAKLRKISQQSQRDDLADSWGRGQYLVFCAPHRALLNGGIKVVIYIAQLLFKPVDVGLDPMAHRLRGSPKTVTLSGEQADELAPTSQYRRQVLCFAHRAMGVAVA